jgi:hypothetical protein
MRSVYKRPFFIGVRMKRFLWLCVIVCLFLICTGCGDTFRPVIIPNPPKFPDPRAAHTVLSVNNNGEVRGSAMVIDVSGDSNVSVADVGIGPVHAVQQTASQVLVVNQGTLATPDESLTKVSFSGTTISNTTTITLPTGSAPNFVATTESTIAYVSLPGLVPPSVGVVNTSGNSLSTTIAVQAGPVAIVETPDGKKLYVANKGAGTISNFNTIDHSPRNPAGPIALSSPPIWLAARSDSQRVFVLEKNGKLATLDTTATAGPDILTESSFSIPGATYMVYDGHLNRLYIPSTDLSDVPTPARLAVVDVSGPQPAAPVIVRVTTVAQSSRNAQDPCASTGTDTLKAVSATSLPDGSRAYLGSFYADGAGNICPQVTVINTSSNTIKTTAAIPGFPDATDSNSPFFVPVCADPTRFRFMMAAGGDSSRVYLSSCDGGNISFIDTANDTYLLSMPAPVSARSPINGNQPPPQNPVFLIAGP